MDDNGDTAADRTLAPDGTADRRRALPVAPTADEALALIDSFIRHRGLDPKEAADDHGGHHLTLGSAHGQVGVAAMQTEEKPEDRQWAPPEMGRDPHGLRP